MMLTDVGDGTGGIAVQSMVSGLLDMSTSVLDFITANPLMLTMFASSLVGVACYVLKKAKKTAKA